MEQENRNQNLLKIYDTDKPENYPTIIMVKNYTGKMWRNKS